MLGRTEYVSWSVRSDCRKIATWGTGSDSEIIGRIVHHQGWETVPFTSSPSGLVFDFLGTSHPQLGSCMSRIFASVVSKIVSSAVGCLLVLTDSISRS
jgi:hypothetical protein